MTEIKVWVQPVLQVWLGIRMLTPPSRNMRSTIIRDTWTELVHTMAPCNPRNTHTIYCHSEPALQAPTFPVPTGEQRGSVFLGRVWDTLELFLKNNLLGHEFHCWKGPVAGLHHHKALYSARTNSNFATDGTSHLRQSISLASSISTSQRHFFV